MTLFPPLKSTYGLFAFLGGYFLSMLMCGVCVAVGIGLQYWMKPEPLHRVLVLTLHVMGTFFGFFAWSFMSGFQVAPFPVSFFCALLFPGIPMSVLLTVLLSPKDHNAVFRRTFHLWNSWRRKKTEADTTPTSMREVDYGGARGGEELHEVGRPVPATHAHSLNGEGSEEGGSPLKPLSRNEIGGAGGGGGSESEPHRRVHTPPESTLTSPSKGDNSTCATSSTEGGEGKGLIASAQRSNGAANDDDGTQGCYRGAVQGSRPSVSALFQIAKNNRSVFLGVWGLFLVINVGLHVLTYGGCACVQPVEWTTWAGLASQTEYCKQGEPCHAYFLVGQNCSSLNSVVHFVGEKPLNFQMKACLGPPSAVIAATCTDEVGVQHSFELKEHLPVPGDTRYLYHTKTTGLQGDRIYTFVYTMEGEHGGGKVFTVIRSVRTLPCGGAEPITFVGGGDYHTSGSGKQLLENALKLKAYSARFLFVGGDLSYSNNMRFCFRRVDHFLVHMTSFKRTNPDVAGAEDTMLPLLMAVGNHEGGGYGLFNNRKEREEGFFFQPQYFPSFADSKGPHSGSFYQDDDPTATYHRHIIGATGFVVLDSGIIFTIDAQLPFLNDTLQYYSALIAEGSLRNIVVVYHNPAYPTLRSVDDEHSKAVRDKIVPVLDAYYPKVLWVLENHDHCYKRTFPLLNGEKRQGGASVAGGIVYSGDGSLGVAGSTLKAKHRWYHNITRRGNYALSATLLPSAHGAPLPSASNPLVEVEIVEENNNILDTFNVPVA